MNCSRVGVRVHGDTENEFVALLRSGRLTRLIGMWYFEHSQTTRHVVLGMTSRIVARYRWPCARLASPLPYESSDQCN